MTCAAPRFMMSVEVCLLHKDARCAVFSLLPAFTFRFIHFQDYCLLSVRMRGMMLYVGAMIFLRRYAMRAQCLMRRAQMRQSVLIALRCDILRRTARQMLHYEPRFMRCSAPADVRHDVRAEKMMLMLLRALSQRKDARAMSAIPRIACCAKIA